MFVFSHSKLLLYVGIVKVCCVS